jgi:predicted alpha-1,2-mannosidase
LLSYGNENGFTTFELTPSEHGAIIRVTFPAFSQGVADAGFNQTRRIMFALNSNTDQASYSTEFGSNYATVTGSTNANSGGVASNFAHYFYATVTGGMNGDVNIVPFSVDTSTNNGNRWAVLDFDPTDVNTDIIHIRFCTSLISADQAHTTYQREVGGLSFDLIRNNAYAAWNNVLGRVNITDFGAGYSPAQINDLTTSFYTAMYRVSLFPRKLWEIDAGGNPIHWAPSTGVVNPGPMSCDAGSWDAYRSTFPFLALTSRTSYGWMVQGSVNAFQESGWLPQWPSPGDRVSMVGSMADNILADAIVKGIPGFNVSGAYEAIRQDAFVVPPKGEIAGRACLDSYISLGYVANDAGCSEELSRSLLYYQADFAIAGAATFLGHTSDATILYQRAANYSKVFDSTTGFFRPKMSDGTWKPNFDQFAWGDSYTEAGPWQYKHEVPFDAVGLSNLYTASGLDLCASLEQANTMPSIVHLGGYGSLIHEMTEMQTLCWGQWELNNQPVWAMEWMYLASQPSVNTSCASSGQKWLRQSNSLLKPGGDMFPGDEDNGSMSAWFLLNMLGLYTLEFGTPNYILGSPLFANVTVTPDDGSSPFIISAVNQGPNNVYVKQVTWNGQVINGVRVSINDLLKGGVLEFTMSNTPTEIKKDEKKEL